MWNDCDTFQYVQLELVLCTMRSPWWVTSCMIEVVFQIYYFNMLYALYEQSQGYLTRQCHWASLRFTACITSSTWHSQTNNAFPNEICHSFPRGLSIPFNRKLCIEPILSHNFCSPPVFSSTLISYSLLLYIFFIEKTTTLLVCSHTLQGAACQPGVSTCLDSIYKACTRGRRRRHGGGEGEYVN